MLDNGNFWLSETPDKPSLGWDAQYKRICSWIKLNDTFNGFKMDAPLKDRIDYIFVSKHFKVDKYGVLTDSFKQRFPSDHMPVVVRLFLK